VKIRLTAQWFRISHDGLGDATWKDPSGDPKTIVIDTEVDRRYDGAKTVEDVKTTFLQQSHTPDPMHNVVLEVTECVEF